jgi:hypothetical protein
MRCVDVIRELITPSDTSDAAALFDHLSRCSSCAAFATHAARLNRLWEATRPPEPAPEVWDNLWSQVAHSLDGSTPQEAASPSLPARQNGSPSTSVLKFEVEPHERSLTPSFRSRLWAGIGIVGLSQAAALLLVAGLTWCFFIPSKQEVASLNPSTSNPATPNSVVAFLPSVDIEAGQVVVILVDPKCPSVVDRTSKAMIAGVDREYVDWYGDERYFDWPQVFNEVESLAKPKVAME